MVSIGEVGLKIDSHIDICSIRYAALEKELCGVHARLKRLEQIGLAVAGAIILLLLNLVLKT
jgi:hypothetical protein